MIRAYHDPALRHPVTRDGTWGSPVEFVCANTRNREKTIYLHNPTNASLTLALSASASGFVLILPQSIYIPPGVTPLTVSVQAGALPLPTTVDFAITGHTTIEASGDNTYTNDAYTDISSTYESTTLSGTLLRAEATAFALPTADERFADGPSSPLRTVATLTDYLASGMGFVDDEYKNTLVAFMADHLRDWGVWALNKHYLFNARYGPMRHARDRAASIGYKPPGVPSLHPAIRRSVYSRAYSIARGIGSAAGIRAVLSALGIPQTEFLIWREGFTWEVRVPQWVAANFNIDFIGNLVLYHVDPWCIVNISVNENTLDGQYTSVDWMIEPGHAVQPPPAGDGGFLLLEDGIAYLLLEDGNKLILQGVVPPETDVTVDVASANVPITGAQARLLEIVTYNGEVVTYDGEDVTY